MNFEQAFANLLKHEGGFSDHKDDPGGRTMFGITESVARRHGYSGDMRNLSIEVAKRIYRESYWDTIFADELPSEIRYAMFDAAVNSGVGQSIRWLQRALNVADDGKLGPVTIGAAKLSDGQTLKAKILSQRLLFMTQLSNWNSFSRGWARRIADLMC